MFYRSNATILDTTIASLNRLFGLTNQGGREMQAKPVFAAGWTVAAVIAAVLAPPMAHAEKIELSAKLSGASEVPPNDSTAKGSVMVTYDTSTRELNWSISFEGMSGPLIGSHIHGPAPANANAGILIGIETGISPLEGTMQINDEQAGHLTNGNSYVNLHTEKYPSGELRGQLLR